MVVLDNLELTYSGLIKYRAAVGIEPNRKEHRERFSLPLPKA